MLKETEIVCRDENRTLYNVLDFRLKRKISTCNFNQHISATHPDRIMQEHDLVYIKEGSWCVSQDGIDYDLNPGDIILLQSGHHHYGVTACQSVVKTCFVHFSSAPEDNICQHVAEDENMISFPVVVHCGSNAMVEHYFNRMIHTFWSDEPMAGQKAAAYLELCLCEICGCQHMTAPFSPMVEEIKLQIRKTPQRFISNQEFAERFGVSVRTLTTKFKECTGSSLHAWQMELKCRMADDLMNHDPSLTLREIASIFGFCDEYHFGKCYKKCFGCSPVRKRR